MANELVVSSRYRRISGFWSEREILEEGYPGIDTKHKKIDLKFLKNNKKIDAKEE